MNSQEIKLKAKQLQERAKQYGYELKHSHCLELASQLINETNWHVSSLIDPEYLITGIKSLDVDLMGGLKKGTVTSIVGGTNTGKTMFSLSIVCNNLRRKRKVLIYNLEGTRNEAILRITSNLANVEYAKLIREELTNEEKKKIEKVKSKYLDKYLVIKNMLNFNVTIDDISNDIFNERRDFKFELLFIDYGQLLTSKNNNLTHREMMVQIYRQFNNIAKVYDCALISPVQATRMDNYGKVEGVLRSSDISEAFEIARLSSNILTINVTDKERQESEMRIYLEKQRSGIKGKVYSIKVDFPKCNLII